MVLHLGLLHYILGGALSARSTISAILVVDPSNYLVQLSRHIGDQGFLGIARAVFYILIVITKSRVNIFILNALVGTP